LSGKDIFTGLKIGFLFVGTIIGAGFASGKEILVFFGNSGSFFIFACILCLVLFCLVAIMFMLKARDKKLYTVQDLSKHTFKAGSGVFTVFIMICQIIILAGMLAAVDSLFLEVINVKFGFPLFSLFALALACIVVSFGINGLIHVNTVLFPLIFLAIILIAIFSKRPQDGALASDVLGKDSFFKTGLHAVTYVGMNMLLTFGVLINPCKKLEKKHIYLGAVLGSVFISLMLFVVGNTLLNSSAAVVKEDMPLLFLTNGMHVVFKIIYACVILCGIFTSVIASMFPVAEYLKKYIKNKYLSIFLVALFGFVLSRIGFSAIVGILYPAMGVVGVIFIVLFYFLTKDKKTNDKKTGYKKFKSKKAV